MYLNRDLNSLKGVLFGQKNPSVKDKSKSILKLAQLGSLSEYLHDDHVVAIYRAVSNRVKARFVNFGAACAAVDSGDGRFKAFKDLEGVDWASAYESWEGEYLRKVEENTRAFVVAVAAQARSQAEDKIKELLLPIHEGVELVRMLGTLEAKVGRLSLIHI